MAVYVDNMQARYGRMIMCHMVADKPEELHKMALRIGVRRRWFQAKADGHSIDHYDICLSKRCLAIKFGAKELNRQELVQFLRRKYRKEKNK